MPDSKEIGRLVKIIRGLADESAVLAARGETIAEMPPPPSVKSLPPAETPRQRPPSAPVAREKSPPDDSFAAAPDFSSLLADLDLDAAAQELPDFAGTMGTEPENDSQAMPSGFDDLDALLGGAAESETADFGQASLPEPGSMLDETAGEAADSDSTFADPFPDVDPDAGSSEPAPADESDFDLGDFAAAMPGEEPAEPEPGSEGEISESLDGPGTLGGPALAADDPLSFESVGIEEPVAAGAEAPEAGEETPEAGEETPEAGEETPEAGEEAPDFTEAFAPSESAEILEPEDAFEAPGLSGSTDAPSSGYSDISAESFDFGTDDPPEPGTGLSFDESAPVDSGQAIGADGGLATDAPSDAGPEGDPPSDEPAAGGEDAFGSFSIDLGGEGQGGELSSGMALGEPGAGDQNPFASFNFGEEPAEAGKESFDAELASLDQPIKASDTFNLDGVWGSEEKAEGLPSWEGAPDAKPRKGGGDEGIEELEADVSLTEKELDNLQDSLLSYPLNLRLEIERSLTEDRLTDQQEARIVTLLAQGALARDVAAELGRMIGKRIQVPAGFEKRTGEDFEAKQGTFWYAFKTNILPLAAISLGAVILLAGLTLLGYQFVYKPLYADSLYRDGYRSISDDDFVRSEQLFDKAFGARRVRSWHFRFAEAYASKRQYPLAEKKYEEILRRYGRDKKGAMDYARLESTALLDYAKAESILKRTILTWRPKDADALMLLGDNYIGWSDDSAAETDRAVYLEGARKAYASLIRIYGRKDPYLAGMLRYFIRTDKIKEVLPLRDYLAAAPKAKVDAPVYAELAGYLLDKGTLDYVQVLLKAGVARDPKLPDNHYQLARFFKLSSVPDEERKALALTVAASEAATALTRKQTLAYIDALKWSGQWYFKARQYLTSEEFFQKAASAYEKALAKRYAEPGERFGEIYSGLADVYYYDRKDLSTAYGFYQRAEANGYSTKDTNYKRGYISYRRSEFREALSFFYAASLDSKEEDNLLYSMANAFFQRDDFAAAAGYYKRLAQRLRDELDRFVIMDPQERPEQGRVVFLLMTTSNNLGVSLYRLAGRTGNASGRSEAMVNLAESARLADAMVRDQLTMLRPNQINLAYLNQDGLLHPSRTFVPQIYPGIPKDLVDSDEKAAIDAMLYSGGM